MIETQEIVKTSAKVILRPEPARILHWDKAIFVRRDSVLKIPRDETLIAQAKISIATNKVVESILAERILDKMVYYYFHFLVSSQREAKSHYYNAYFSLSSAMAKMGCPQAHYKEIKSIAMEKKKRVDKIVKGLRIRKDDVPALLSFRELSKQYEQFKTDNTVYGENVPLILSELVKLWSVEFY